MVAAAVAYAAIPEDGPRVARLLPHRVAGYAGTSTSAWWRPAWLVATLATATLTTAWFISRSGGSRGGQATHGHGDGLGSPDEAMSAFAADAAKAPSPAAVCPGTLGVMPGYGAVSLINARWNKPNDPAGKVEVLDGAVVCHMKGRTYFGDGCASSAYSNTAYVGVQLLGRTMRYTVDLSGTTCGCNAALYLTNLKQNREVSACFDHYCDANKVCGVNCAEIDIQEANRVSWYSTLRSSDDGGGYGAGHRHWNLTVYGPGARCIDTNKPMQVAASFPIDAGGKLTSMQVTLSQPGSPCPLTLGVDRYMPFGRDGMAEMTTALAAGMTPIISYWGKGENMLWMDGRGGDGLGPCDADTPAACAETVRFYDFSIT